MSEGCLYLPFKYDSLWHSIIEFDTLVPPRHVKDLGKPTANYTMSRANGETPLKDTAGRVELHQMLLMIEVGFCVSNDIYDWVFIHSLQGRCKDILYGYSCRCVKHFLLTSEVYDIGNVLLTSLFISMTVAWLVWVVRV